MEQLARGLLELKDSISPRGGADTPTSTRSRKVAGELWRRRGRGARVGRCLRASRGDEATAGSEQKASRAGLDEASPPAGGVSLRRQGDTRGRVSRSVYRVGFSAAVAGWIFPGGSSRRADREQGRAFRALRLFVRVRRKMQPNGSETGRPESTRGNSGTHRDIRRTWGRGEPAISCTTAGAPCATACKTSSRSARCHRPPHT